VSKLSLSVEPTALTLPDPSTASVAAIMNACRSVYAARDELIGGLSLTEAIELRRRSSAIEDYLRGTEAYPDGQRAARVLEMAVGAALGKAQPGRPVNGEARASTTLAADKDTAWVLAHEFRQLNKGRDKIEPYLETDGLSREAALRIAKGGHVSANSGENEWFTPAEYIAAAVEVMGGIDLDPASSEAANAVVGADTFYAPPQDGLDYPWRGRVWMNPPYSQPAIWHFCEKLSEEVANGAVTQAIVLVNNATDTAWFQRMAEVAGAICFPSKRVKFWHPDRVAAPLQGQAVLYFGDRIDAFRAEFLRFGFTVAL
jgi:hypothetical protein